MKRKFWLLLALMLALSLIWCGAASADSSFPPLTVDGKTENITVDFNGSPTIRVLTPGEATALFVEAERVSGGDEYQHWDEAVDRYRLSQCYEFSRTFYDTGVWEVTARYTTDDYPDGTDLYQAELNWIPLGSVEVSVDQWIARLAAPNVTMSASSASQGDWIYVTVNNFQGKNEWYWYDLDRMNGETGDWEWQRHEDAQLMEGINDTFAVPTIDLMPGTYRMWIRTEAVRYEDNGVYKVFTVTENSSLSDGITLSAPSVPVDVPVYVGVRATGADWMEVRASMEEDPFWWDRWTMGGDCSSNWFDFDRPGTFHLTLNAWENGESRVVGEAVLNVTAQSYLEDPEYMDFPGVLSEGEDLEGLLILDERTERYFIDLQYCPDNGNWTSLFRADRWPADPSGETLSLPGFLFTQEGLYRLHVHAYAMGVDSSYNEFWFLRSDADSSVSLTVNGEPAGFTAPSSTDLQIEIIAPEATAARLLIGNRWEYRNSPREFNFYTSMGSGDYALVAQVTYDDPVWNEEGFDWSSFRWETDVNWEDCSNTIFMHVRDYEGRLDRPAVTLDSDSAPQGEWLHATVESQDRDEWYWAQVNRLWTDEYGIQRDYVMDCDWNGVDGFDIPTAVLDPGEYCLTVGVDAVGWRNAEASVPFTVTEGEMEDLALLFARDEILTSQDVSFFAYAAGADFMTVDVTWDRDPHWRNLYQGGGSRNNWRWGVSDAGVYTFTLIAWQGEDCLGETSFTLTVNAPYGELQDPVVEDLPAVVETGNPVNTVFSIDDNAESIGIRLTYCGTDGPWEMLVDEWRRADEPEAGALYFSPDTLSLTGVYRLEIDVTGLGWNGAHLMRTFLVTEPMENSLVLTVNNGSDEDIYLHMNVPVRVEVPEGVTAVRLWSSANDWWDYGIVSGDSFEWYRGFHQSGEEILVAQATTDSSVTEWLDDPSHDGMMDFDWGQVNWTLSSEPCTVPVICYGDLENPEVSFPDGTTVERGETLRLLVSPVDNAYCFGVQVRRDMINDWFLFADMEYIFADGGEVLLPTDALEPGDYVVCVDPRSHGWQGYTVEYPFTVTEPASWSDEPVFRVIPDQLQTREYITYSLYAPGAREVMVCNEAMENQWRYEGGESLMDRVMLNWAKVYHLYAYANYSEGDGNESEWQQVGYAEVTVTAPNGAVDVTLDAPARKSSTEAWTISLLCDFKGTEGDADCFLSSATGEWEITPELVDVTDEGELTRFTYQVEANSLAVGPYYITAYAYPGDVGYELGFAEGMVEISDGSIEAVLTVSPNPAEIFDDLDVTLSAPGATAVAIRSDLNGMAWVCEFGDTVHDILTAWEPGEGRVYGYYTTQALDPDDPDFSWDDVAWEGMSNTVTVTVSEPIGELEPLNVDLQSDTVKRGEYFVLTVLNENPGLDVSYGAHLVAPDTGEGEYGYPWFGPDEGTQTIRVETLPLPPGEYTLMISAVAHGYLPVMLELPVTVTELSTLSLPAGLTNIETEAFANVAAERIVIPSGVASIASDAFTDCTNLVELVLPEGIGSFAPDALGTTGPVYVVGEPGSYLETYAELVDNLIFVPSY